MTSKTMHVAVASLFTFSVMITPIVAFAQSGGAGSGDGLDSLFNEINKEITADDTHNAADTVASDKDKWSYADKKVELFVDMTADTYAMLKTTQAKYDNKPVEKYRIYYANKSIQSADPKDISEKVVEVESTTGNYVMLKFDGLKPETQYFAVVAPVNPTDPTDDGLDMITEKEVSFTTAKVMAAGDAEVFNNVSYTYENNMVTLTWTPGGSAEKAEIYIRHQGETAYDKLGTPMASDGKYTFKVTKAGNYFVKMVGLDNKGSAVGKEHVQTVKVDKVDMPEEPVKAAPKVGAATDILVGLAIIGVVMYFVYRFRRNEY